VLLIPLLQLVGYTDRQQGDSLAMYSNLLREPPLTLVQNIVLFPGLKYQAEAVRGAGVLALTLLVMALCSARWRRSLLFLLLLLILIDCSFGPPLPVSRLVSFLTPFALSAYTRAFDVALIPLALLVGVGVDSISTPARSSILNALKAGLLLATGLALVIGLTRWLPEDNYLKASWLVTGIPTCGLVLFAAGLVLGRPRLVEGLVCALVFAELFTWNQYYISYLLHRRFIEPSMSQTPPAYPQDNSRGVDPNQLNGLYTLGTYMNGYEPLHLERVRSVISGPPRAGNYYRAVRFWECTAENSRGHLLMKRLFWLARRQAPGPLPSKDSLFPPTTTVYTGDITLPTIPQVTRESVETTGVSSDTLIQPLTDAAFFGVPLSVDRDYTHEFSLKLPVDAPGRPPGPAGALHSVLRLRYQATGAVQLDISFRRKSIPDPVPGRRLILSATKGKTKAVETPLPDYPDMETTLLLNPHGGGGVITFQEAAVVSDRKDEDGLLQNLRRGENRVTLDTVDLPDYRVLVFLDAFYPGWKAYVDDAETAIFLVDDAFKAVVVPPGTHRVRFEYRPQRAYAGVVVSATGILIAVLGILLFRATPPMSARLPEKAP